jgi:hypothetical protein
MTTCKDCEDSFRDANIFKEMMNLSRKSSRPAVGNEDVWVPLILFRSRLYQNPLDKVYAFLAVMEQQWQHEILIDYNMSPQSLYKQLFIIDTTRSKSFRSLGFVTHNNANSNNPSWLPEWAVATPCYHDTGLYERHNLYSASKWRKPDFDMGLLEWNTSCRYYSYWLRCYYGKISPRAPSGRDHF